MLGIDSSCEYENCTAAATHRVIIAIPSEEPETWGVCRLHDRALKTQAVASRPKAMPPKEQPTTVQLCCGACQRQLDERPDLPAGERAPCPACGSTQRVVKVALFSTLSLHDSIRARSRSPGKGGWRLETKTGDDYTRMLDGWGHRELTTDRDGDGYRELIELHDGTTIESTARLSDHRN